MQFTDTAMPAGPSTTPPTSWAWDFDDNGTTDATTPNPVHAYGAPGTYDVKLTVTNAAGPHSVTQPVVVTGPSWTGYETLNAASQFGGGNTLLPYGTQIQASTPTAPTARWGTPGGTAPAGTSRSSTAAGRTPTTRSART